MGDTVRSDPPEMRALAILSLESATHWSTVARRLHLRPGSAQQYLSRLARQGLARRVAAGWYVRAQATAFAWSMTGALRAALDAASAAGAGDRLCGWAGGMFAGLPRGAELPPVLHLAVAPGSAAAVRECAAVGTKSTVMVEESAETAFRDRIDPTLASPERALADLIILAARGRLDVDRTVLETVAQGLYAERLLNLSRLRRYAMRRAAEQQVIALVAPIVPQHERRLLRSVLDGLGRPSA